LPRAKSAGPKPNGAASDAIDPEIAAPEPIQRVKGYVPPPRWIRATADWQETDEPLSAEIDVAGLTMLGIGWLWDEGLSNAAVWPFLAARVRHWNALAYDRVSRQWTVAPGPEEIGWKAFALVDPSITLDLMLLVNKAVRGGDDRERFLATSASPPAASAA
jgi:hypothetical protein